MRTTTWLTALVLGLLAAPVSAATIVTSQSGHLTLSGFSDATTGAAGAEWVLDEIFTANLPGTLKFEGDGHQPLQGPVTGIAQSAGKFFAKTVLNNTALAWTSFELELQVVPGTPSGEGDGLSFAQGNGLAFTSSVFTDLTRLDVDRDYLNFSGGVVNPGDSVTFFFAISDNSANNPFYLVQTPNRVDGGSVPEPTTLLLLGAAVGAGILRRRKV